jgi:hypothetical protein
MANDNWRKQLVCLRNSLCTVWLIIVVLSLSSTAIAEPLRIAYTSIAVVYGPLWITQEAGIFKKHGIDPEFIYIAGGPPSLQALIAGDVAISFTAAGATVAANLSGSDVVLLGASIDSLPFELWSIPRIKQPAQLRGTKLGVSRIGATTDFVARYMLKKWGMQTDKDVGIFQAGSGPQVFAALKGGSVQSGVLSTGPMQKDTFGSPMSHLNWFIRLGLLRRASHLLKNNPNWSRALSRRMSRAFIVSKRIKEPRWRHSRSIPNKRPLLPWRKSTRSTLRNISKESRKLHWRELKRSWKRSLRHGRYRPGSGPSDLSNRNSFVNWFRVVSSIISTKSVRPHFVPERSTT